ncbi:MAG: sialate O-acetylesterase [Verrucomicrobiota bacterium]
MRFLFPHCILVLAWILSGLAHAAPTLWIIGDSTVRNTITDQRGWGDPLKEHFDATRIKVVNRAIGGRSSRSFLTEGRWDAVLAEMQPGDFLLMQFGHNDGGQQFDGDRPRASIKGNGDETVDGVVKVTGKAETVHSYGWYLRHYATRAKAHGATPIIVSQIPRNIWKDGKIGRADKDYGLWARQAAATSSTLFIDFNHILADKLQAEGPEKTAALFSGKDHTHTNAAGAVFNAATLAEAIRTLPGCDLGKFLLPENLWLPSIFCDHMVVQRDVPFPVWGKAKPGAEVTARMAGKSVSTHADALGKFRVELPPMTAGGPFTLEVSSSTTRSLADVLVGEVWLCSGQSNMDFTIASTAKRSFAGILDWQQEVAAANAPRIRMFTADWTMQESPQQDVTGTWKIASPDTLGDFSAVAWFFGRSLQTELDVPIGLVTCAYGASTAEAWISEEKLATVPSLTSLLESFEKKKVSFRDDPTLAQNFASATSRWNEEKMRLTALGKKVPRAPRNPDPVQDQHNPGVLFNGMIAPLIPYPMRGVIWYQGESNVGTRALYPALQKALVQDWRARWKLGDFPFYLTQLASHNAPKLAPSESSLATMREAQAAVLALPNTGMAVTLDIGDAKDVHPRNKQAVGHRLAQLALARTYKRPVVASGPVLRDAIVDNGRIRVSFDHIADGLVARGESLERFEIAGEDKKFVRADAVIEGDTIVVSAAAVTSPAFVRYAWADNPEGANLYNSADLPAAPFRTDR